MDYMKYGSLADLISKEEKSLCMREYDDTKRQIILVGIARGMMLLHKHHIIHRDLKPENILLDDDFRPHITDFGLSKFFDPHHSMNQSISNSGTMQYMAPEVINSDHFNTKADVYAFGILMYEVLSGKRAYGEILTGKKKLNDFQLKMKVCQGYRPIIEEGTIKKGLKKIIEKCWSAEPKERPTFSELYRKLSLSKDDYFLEFEKNDFDSNIIESDDDDGIENDDEFIVNKKYCLENVDCDMLFDYIDEINEEPISLINKEQQNEIKEMAEKISSLESELQKSKSEAATLKKQNEKMKSDMEKMANKISLLESNVSKKKDNEPSEKKFK